MTQTSDWRQSPRKRAEVAAIATLGYPVVRALTSTWTWKVSGAEHVDAITTAGHQPILALWHGRILAATPYFQHRGIVAMASENFDGEWIARLLGKFGYGAARGSTSRGGPAALRQLVRDVKAHGVAFTLDGPRGPAEVAQPGAVWLAKATGQPLLPFHSEAASSWTLRELGPHADPEAVHDRRDGDRRADLRATGRRRLRAGPPRRRPGCSTRGVQEAVLGVVGPVGEGNL